MLLQTFASLLDTYLPLVYASSQVTHPPSKRYLWTAPLDISIDTMAYAYARKITIN